MNTLSNRDAHSRDLDEYAKSTMGSVQNSIHHALFFGMNTFKNAKNGTNRK